MSNEERNNQPDANLANEPESVTATTDPDYEEFRKIKRVEDVIKKFENGDGDPVTAEANKALLNLGMREELKKDPDLALNIKAFDLLKRQYARIAKQEIEKQNSETTAPHPPPAPSVNRPDPAPPDQQNPNRERFTPEKISRLTPSEIMERFGVTLGEAIQIKAYPPKHEFEIDRKT